MKKEKERKFLLDRFFFPDEKLYRIGQAAGDNWFDQFKYRYEHDRFFHFGREAKAEAFDRLSDPNNVSDGNFLRALNDVEPHIYKIERFVGENYYFNVDHGEFLQENRQDEVRQDTRNALRETNGRAYYFLKAIIELRRDGRWDDAYGGATWTDILAKIRDLGGGHPAPRDVAIIKSCYIYFKTGSKRYPTHTIPIEMVPTVNAELEKGGGK